MCVFVQVCRTKCDVCVLWERGEEALGESEAAASGHGSINLRPRTQLSNTQVGE